MKKKLAAMLVGGISVLALSGCGMTTEKLVDGMRKAEFNSASTESSLDVDVTVGASGMSLDLGIGGDIQMDFTADGDESNIHMVTDLTMEILGQKQPVETEMYILNDGDEVTTYQLQEDDVWTVSSVENEESTVDEDTVKEVQDAFYDVLKGAELQKKTETVEKEECYVLTMNTGLDVFEDMLKIVYDAQEDTADEAMEEAGLDWDGMIDVLSTINMDLTVYVSKKDNFCRKIVIDLSGTDTEAMIEKIMDLSSSAEELSEGMGVDADNIEIEINALSFEIVFSDINQTEVALPGDVEDEAVDRDEYYGSGYDDDWSDEPGQYDPATDPNVMVDPDPDYVNPQPANNGGIDFESYEWDEETVEAWMDENGGSYAICDYYGNILAYVNLLPGFDWWTDYCSMYMADMLLDEGDDYVDLEINNGYCDSTIQDMIENDLDYFEAEVSDTLESDIYSLLGTYSVSQGTVYVFNDTFNYSDTEDDYTVYIFVLVTGDIKDGECVYFSLNEDAIVSLGERYEDEAEFLHALFD